MGGLALGMQIPPQEQGAQCPDFRTWESTLSSDFRSFHPEKSRSGLYSFHAE